MAIDMWSLGCIVAELALGQPLFPAENEHDLIIRIVSALGLPPASVMAIATRRKTFFDAEFLPLKQGANATAQIAAKAAADAEAAASGIPNHSTAPYYVPPSGTMPPANPLAVVLAKQDPALIDFVTRCLTWNPSDRMSIAEAWNHPWLRNARPGPPPMVLAAQQAAASSSSAASSDASAAASASSSSSSSETVASATLAAAASAATGGVSSSTAEQADSPKQSAMSRATGGGSPLSAGSSSSSSTTSSPSAGDVAAAAHHHAHHHHPAPVVTYSFEELAAGLRALYIGAPPPSTSGAPAVAGYDKAAYQK
ncbi:hypothetical protein H696_04400 [Fonticula alba]|uniref:Protein kinase domain-containing protein n=1 Tax=Fonticula alba TaxID=691883 RepID=A0A058Z4F7_FONAL|nr:hypothetical protein H696_04400 [Fonticula alba]KCV68981.1 hypothetical protein H696_04400 [Fonticula alba]|eukprot:XP_009496552.1 hypothetical protein H696_04400 [Fonticula alba]